MKRRWPDTRATLFALVGSIILVGAVFVSTPLTPHGGGFDSDGRHYAAMAGQPFSDPTIGTLAPFRHRILTPALASLLPFGTLASFGLLAFLSNVLSILLLERILQSLGFAPLLRVLGVGLWAGSFWTLKFSFYSPAYIDHQTQLFLLLLIHLTLRRAYLLLPGVFIAAALQKESLAAYSLFSVVHLWRHGGFSRAWLRPALAVALPLVAFGTVVGVRAAIDVPNTHRPFAVMLEFGARASDPRFWPVLLQAVFSGLGIIPVILLVNYEAWTRFLRENREWIVYALISLVFLFGGNDKARLFLYALPLAVILAVKNVEALTSSTSRNRAIVWGVVVLATHAYIGGYLGPMGSFREYLAQWVPVHSRGRYAPYLVRNLVLACVLFAFTVLAIIGSWRFRFPGGFVGRDGG